MDKMLKPLFKKFSTEELAVKLGVSSSTIFKWKAGEVSPSRLAEGRIKEVFAREVSDKG